MMRIKTVWRRSGLSVRGGFALGVLGIVVVSLSMSGCSSGSGSGDSASGASGFLTVEASGTAGIAPTNAKCGEEQIEILWADETIDVGTVEVSNDLDYLYVKYELEDDWGMLKVCVHVGEDVTDYPGYARPDHNAKVNNFYHVDVPGEGEAWEEYTLAIPFTDLELESGDCGMTFYVFAFATAGQIEDNGAVISSTEWAWGGSETQPDSTNWMYYIEYTVQCCGWHGNQGEFRTQSQGGWGTVCHGWNPGCYRDEWFDVAFPDGVTIGCPGDGQTMTFTTIEEDVTGSEAVREFMPTGGKPGPLEVSYLNRTDKTEAGVLASQLLALALTLGFDATDPDFGSSTNLLADQVICNTGNTDWDEMNLTVQELFDEANLVLGACEGTLGLNAEELADLLTIVNENYVDGEADLGFLCTP